RRTHFQPVAAVARIHREDLFVRSSAGTGCGTPRFGSRASRKVGSGIEIRYHGSSPGRRGGLRGELVNDGPKPRVAYFPDSYYEIDGVANTARHFEAFARDRALHFLIVFAGPRNEITQSGSVTRVQLKRGPARFNLDGAHQYDLFF